MLALLEGQHPRLGAASCLRVLPKCTLRDIAELLRPVCQFATIPRKEAGEHSEVVITELTAWGDLETIARREPFDPLKVPSEVLAPDVIVWRGAIWRRHGTCAPATAWYDFCGYDDPTWNHPSAMIPMDFTYDPTWNHPSAVIPQNHASLMRVFAAGSKLVIVQQDLGVNKFRVTVFSRCRSHVKLDFQTFSTDSSARSFWGRERACESESSAYLLPARNRVEVITLGPAGELRTATVDCGQIYDTLSCRFRMLLAMETHYKLRVAHFSEEWTAITLVETFAIQSYCAWRTISKTGLVITPTPDRRIAIFAPSIDGHKLVTRELSGWCDTWETSVVLPDTVALYALCEPSPWIFFVSREDSGEIHVARAEVHVLSVPFAFCGLDSRTHTVAVMISNREGAERWDVFNALTGSFYRELNMNLKSILVNVS